MQAEEVYMAKWFHQDVSEVVAGANSGNLQLALGDHVADVMEFHPDVFDVRVKDVIFGEAGCSIIVTVKGGGVGVVKA